MARSLHVLIAIAFVSSQALMVGSAVADESTKPNTKIIEALQSYYSGGKIEPLKYTGRKVEHFKYTGRKIEQYKYTGRKVERYKYTGRKLEQ